MRFDNYQRRLKIELVTAPASEPVSLAEAKSHCRVTLSDDDSLITGLIKAARSIVEEFTGYRMVSRTERLNLDFFPPVDQIVVPVAPVTALGDLIYYDEDDNPTTFASSNYVVDLTGPIARLVLKSGVCWPDLGSDARPINAVRLGFCSGHDVDASPPDEIPEPLKLAVKMLVGHYYENREESSLMTVKTVPMGITTLITPYRVWEAL